MKKRKRLLALLMAFLVMIGCGRVEMLAVNAEEVQDVVDTLDSQKTEKVQETEEQKESNDKISDEMQQEVQVSQEEAVEKNAKTVTETEKNVETEDLKENSWRYSDGRLINNDESVAAYDSRNISTAWKKVNGRYVNDKGQIIPGAQKKGIDVSKWQEKIDWEKVKADGVEFAIIRCGYGNNTTSHDDAYWEYNVSECERLGIPYGVYLYSYATDLDYAKSEAEHTLRLLKGHHPTLPVYYDLEDTKVKDAGQTMIGKMAQTYCNTVSEAGYRVGIYASLSWWNGCLNTSVFQNSSWSKWVAQWNSTCDYKGSYDMWQCSEKGTVNGIDGQVDLDFWMVKTADVEAVEVADANIINYTSHMQTFGWQDAVTNGYQTGITGYSKRMEAFKINVGEGYNDLGVRYSAHVQGYGWQNYVSNGEIAGTTGEGKRVEAVKIELTGNQASEYDIYYRVHTQDYGWLDWAKNGEPAGTQGYSKRLEALQIAVLPKESDAPGSTENSFKQNRIKYRAHVQTYGWQDYQFEGETSGTNGQSKRLEAIQIQLQDQSMNQFLEYKTHVQTYGWLDWVNGGKISGTSGQSKRLEAIQIRLRDELEETYDIYYRVHAQTYGWLDWAKNGESAGTEGLSKRLEAIQIVLVEKGGVAPGKTDTPFVKK
mgnify:FL=1